MNDLPDSPIDRINVAKSHDTSSEMLTQLSKICTDFGNSKYHTYAERRFELAVAIANNSNTPLHVLKNFYRNAECIADAPPGTLDYCNVDWENIRTLKTAIERNPNWQKADLKKQ